MSNYARPLPPDHVFDEITEDDVLADWERDFLASVGSQDYDLTDRQQEKLDEIAGSIPLRLQLAREGKGPI